MPFGMKLFLFVSMALVPSFMFGLYRARIARRFPFFVMRGFVLAVLLLMLWSILALQLSFQPATPIEAMPMLFFALFGTGFAIIAGMLAPAAWAKICYWAEKADKWMYSHTP